MIACRRWRRNWFAVASAVIVTPASTAATLAAKAATRDDSHRLQHWH